MAATSHLHKQLDQMAIFWARGLSFAQIAETLATQGICTSRSAIAGLVYRNREKFQPRVKPPRIVAPKLAPRRHVPISRKSDAVNVYDPSADVVTPDSPDIVAVSRCRYPIGTVDDTHVFCNRPRNGGTNYCAHHYAITVRR